MANPSETIGAAGYFVSAVLETAGSVALSNMLVTWEGAFRVIGVALFIVSAMIALRQFLEGNSVRPLWLVLGPALLFGVLWTTVPLAPPREVKLGERTLADSVKAMIAEYSPTNKYQIPLLLHVANRVADTVVDAIAGLLGNQDNKAAYQAAVTDRVYTEILFAKGEDREFLELLVLSLMGDCSQVMLLSKELSEPRLRYAVPGSAAAIEAAGKQLKLASYRERRLNLSPSVLSYLNGAGVTARPDPTCEETWQYSAAASLKVVEKLLSLTSPIRQKYLNFTDDEWLEIIDEIEFRLGVPTDDPMVRAQGLRMLSGVFLHNSMNSSTLSAFLTMQQGRQGWMFPGQEKLDPEKGEGLTSTLRLVSTRFAASVPYVQGMLLYLLTIGFPFFVLSALVPTRANAILLWLSLWFWVKSWSIGYAIVWAIRDIFYQTLPPASLLLGDTPVAEINWNDPSSIFYFASAEEAVLQLNSYQSTIAVLVLSVPALSAYMFRGASSLLRIASNGLANSDGLQRRNYRGDDNQQSVINKAQSAS